MRCNFISKGAYINVADKLKTQGRSKQVVSESGPSRVLMERFRHIDPKMKMKMNIGWDFLIVLSRRNLAVKYIAINANVRPTKDRVVTISPVL